MSLSLEDVKKLYDIYEKCKEINLPIDTMLAEFNRLEDVEFKLDQAKERIADLETICYAKYFVDIDKDFDVIKIKGKKYISKQKIDEIFDERIKDYRRLQCEVIFPSTYYDPYCEYLSGRMSMILDIKNEIMKQIELEERRNEYDSYRNRTKKKIE